MQVRNGWYWMPPVARVAVAAGPVVGLGWYPGRVAWIHSGAEIGWVPLAPAEQYYSHRRWGPRSVVVAGGGVAGIGIGLANLRYVGHAVVVNQRNFYGVNNYRTVRVTNINRTTIINNYRAAPVVNNTVINNYGSLRQRHNFTTAPVTQQAASDSAQPHPAKPDHSRARRARKGTRRSSKMWPG